MKIKANILIFYFFIDIAEACLYLASSKSRYVTGTTIEVAGISHLLLNHSNLLHN